MRRWLFGSLAKLYPKAWRELYGDEVGDLSEELLAAGEVKGPRLALELALSGLAERLRSWRRARLAVVSGSVALVVVLGLALSLGGAFQRPSTLSTPPCVTVRHPEIKVTGIREVPSSTEVKSAPAKLLPQPGNETPGHRHLKVTGVEQFPPSRLTVRVVVVRRLPVWCS